MPSFRVSPDPLSTMGAAYPKVTDRAEAQPAVTVSHGPRTGLLSFARGVIFADRGAFGALTGILAPITTQGAAFVFADRLARASDMDDLLMRLRDEWGRVDFVIHCAMPSHSGPQGGSYVDTDIAAFQAAMAGCVHSFAATAARAMRFMAPGGSLLSVNWPSGGVTSPGHGLFEVVRAAQAASVRSLAEDLGPRGIRVNAIAGGPVRRKPIERRASSQVSSVSERHRAPLRRDVTPEEIGKAAVYLLSELSSGTTGVTLHVDAGHHVNGLRGVAPP